MATRVQGAQRTLRCITCQERKVKCDQRQPFCARCERGSRQCGGYNRPVVIVQETGRPRSLEKPVQLTTSRRRNSRENNTPPLIHSLHPSENTRFKDHFLSRFVYQGATASALIRVLAKKVEYEDVPEGSLPQLCVKAITATFYGKINNDQNSYVTGLSAHNNALNKLQRALYRPNEYLNTETLMSVLLLCIYENIAADDHSTWLKHYNGISTLIENRGPHLHESGIEKEILMACRYMIIVSAATHRHPCFLAQDAWKALLRSPQFNPHMPWPSLLYTLADVPGLFYDFDILRLRGILVNNNDAFTALRYRTANTLLELYKWKSSLPITSLSNSQDTDAALALHHGTLLSMEELSSLLSLVLQPRIAATSSLTERLMHSDLLYQDGIINDPIRRAERHALATEIYNLARSSIHETNSFPGALFFILPLWIAAHHTDPSRAEHGALQEYMDTVIAKSHGFGLGRKPG